MEFSNFLISLSHLGSRAFVVCLLNAISFHLFI